MGGEYLKTNLTYKLTRTIKLLLFNIPTLIGKCFIHTVQTYENVDSICLFFFFFFFLLPASSIFSLSEYSAAHYLHFETLIMRNNEVYKYRSLGTLKFIIRIIMPTGQKYMYAI